MKNTTSRRVGTLATALIIALPLTVFPSAVAQSEVKVKVTDVATASGGEVLLGTALSTTTAPNEAVLVIGDSSNARGGGVDVTGHSDHSNIGAKNLDVQNTPKSVIPDLEDVPVGVAPIDAPPPLSVSSPTTKSPDAENPAYCSSSEVPGLTVSCERGSRVESALPFTATVSLSLGGPSFESAETGGTIVVRNNSVVRTTLADVNIPANLAKRGDPASNDVRIGGIAIK